MTYDEVFDMFYAMAVKARQDKFFAFKEQTSCLRPMMEALRADKTAKKMKVSDFERIRKSIELKSPTDSGKYREALDHVALHWPGWKNPVKSPLDLVGKFLDHKFDKGGNLGITAKDRIGSEQMVVAKDVKGVQIYTAVPVPGRSFQIEYTGQVLNFKFLKYAPYYVTLTPIIRPLTRIVMTGPMSGCYLFLYRYGGNQYLSHVGTDCDADLNRKVKIAWCNYLKKNLEPGSVTGVSPKDFYTEQEYRNAMQQGFYAPDIYGYFDQDAAYSMLVVQVLSSLNPDKKNLVKVVSVKPVKMEPWLTARRPFAKNDPDVMKACGL